MEQKKFEIPVTLPPRNPQIADGEPTDTNPTPAIGLTQEELVQALVKTCPSLTVLLKNQQG